MGRGRERENMREMDQKKAILKNLENKSTVFQKEEITKRNFYL